MIKDGIRLFQNSPIPLLIIENKSRQILQANRSFRKKFYTENEIQGKTKDSFFKPVFHDSAPRKEENQGRGYYTLSFNNNRSILVEVIEQDISDDDNEMSILWVLELFPDLSKPGSVNHPLYKAIFDKAKDIILIADDNGRFIQVNETACNKLGYTLEEFRQLSVADITSAPHKDTTLENWDNFIEDGTDEGEYYLKTKNGKILYTEYRAVSDIQPGQHLSILRDVTRQKEIEKSERLKTDAIAFTSNPMACIDDQFKIKHINPACLNLWGYESEKDVIGKQVQAFFSQRKRFELIQDQLLEQGSWNGRLNGRRVNGELFDVEISINRMPKSSAGPPLWIVSFKEIDRLLTVERKLRKLENRLGKFLDSAPNAIMIIDQNGSIELCNRQTENIFGYKSQELIGQPIEVLVPHSYRSGHKQKRDNYIKNPEIRPMGSGLNLLALRKDGTTFPVDVMLGPLQGEDMGSTLAIIRDMSDYREAADKLSVSETRFRTLFETAQDPILIYRKNKLVDANSSAKNRFKTVADFHNISPESLFTLNYPDPESAGEEFLDKAQNFKNCDPVNFEWVFYPESDNSFYADVTIVPMTIQSDVHYQVQIQDISDRKEAEALLEINMEKFSQLFYNSPDGLVLLNMDGEVEQINKSFQTLFGYSTNDVVGKDLNDLIVPKDSKSISNLSTEFVLNGGTYQKEGVRITKSGKTVPVIIGGIPVKFKNRVIAAFGLYIDISERKKAEQQAVESLQEKNVLLKEIHHRVKNNLALVSGLLELQKQHFSNSELQNSIQESQDRIKSMSLVHEQLYQMELFAALKFDEYIYQLSNNLIQTYSHTDIDLRVNVEPVQLTMDTAIPCALLLNEIFTNALKHAFPDGKKGTLNINLQKKGDSVCLKVADDGIGIPDALLDGDDSSLGMLLIHTLATQIEADIKIKNSEGTEYIILFPQETD